jgi:hypothetical protein
MVRYKTTDAHADTNAALVRAVFEELRAKAPSGIRYATYRLPDGASFMHIATIDTPENPLTTLPAFQTFQRELAERCVERPVVTEISPVDSYGMGAS